MNIYTSYYKLLAAINYTVSINSMVSVNNSISQYCSITNNSNNQGVMYYYRLPQLVISKPNLSTM